MFAGIPGQEQAKAFFEHVIRAGTLSHAYLLAGPEGLAKTEFARELGAALVAPCENCGACAECERARRGMHPDLHLLEREGDLIRVDQIEPVVADLSLKPFSAARRVWVIPEVEYLHPAVGQQAAQEHRGAAVLRRLPPRHGPAGARAADHRLALPGGGVPAAQRHRRWPPT